MTKSIRIAIPEGMTPTVVAETFAAYLSGSLVFGRGASGDEHHRHGPFQKEKGNDKHWQLDPANEFFLHFEDDGRHASIQCRYEGREEAVLKVVVELFNLRYGKWVEIG